MTTTGYFIGYAKNSKGYKFYCPSHNTNIAESRSAKFLENDLISGADNRWSIESIVDHLETQPSTSGNRLIVKVHNTSRAQICVERPIQPNSKVDDHDIVD